MARNVRKLAVILRALCLILLFSESCVGKGDKTDKKAKQRKEKSSKIGKDILDYTESDIYKLLDQWDENDDEIDEEDRYDDYDPRKQKPAGMGFDPSQFAGDPMAIMRAAKKGKVVMMFVSVAGNPTRKDTEQITDRWQTSLFNAQFQVERYLVADDRVLFLLKDGSLAWDVKDFLITQPDCKLVEFENQQFPGAGANAEATKTEL